MQFTYHLAEGNYLHFAVQLEGKQLRIHRHIHAMVVDRYPPEQLIDIENHKGWEALCAFLEAQTWESKYFNPNIIDGSQWYLTYQRGKCKIKSWGSNTEPPHFPEFKRLLKAIVKKF